MNRTCAALLCLLAAILATPAFADVYKWVDAAGVTHFSDTPPPARDAQKIGVRAADPSWPNRHAARVRAADNAVRLSWLSEPGRAPENGATAGATPGSVPGSVPTMRPFNAPSDTTREQRMAEYRASQECFAPYVNVNGSTKAEAFNHCSEMKEPSRQP